jgi:uncharacterized protein (DUF983 family)
MINNFVSQHCPKCGQLNIYPDRIIETICITCGEELRTYTPPLKVNSTPSIFDILIVIPGIVFWAGMAGGIAGLTLAFIVKLLSSWLQ